MWSPSCPTAASAASMTCSRHAFDILLSGWPWRFLLIRKLALFVCLATLALAQSDVNQIFYTVSLASRADHVVHVTVRVPSTGATRHELVLPVWNATYMVRDFSQYVTKYSAHDDASTALPVTTVDQTTWRVESAAPFVFEYDIVADNAG